MMKVAVIGLGYVGTVIAGLLAEQRQHVIGVDVDPAKVAALNEGQATFSEPGLERLLLRQRLEGRLEATTDLREAVRQSQVIMVCVGTPSAAQGLAGVDLSAVVEALTEIGAALPDGYPVVVLRSTVPPDSPISLAQHVEHVSGKRIGVDFGFCVQPEFLREGFAIQDFREPPLLLIGEHQDDHRSAGVLLALYHTSGYLRVAQVVTDMETALLVKYVSNAWHALKVTFANEIGTVAEFLGLDGETVMEIMCQDRQLNISPAYLRPGGPFGGSCLPKDLRALNQMMPLDLPVLAAIQASNAAHIARLAHQAGATGAQNVVIIGASFKAGTDDLRESPWLQIADLLTKAGCQVSVYDPEVRREAAPWLQADLPTLLAWADCVIVGKPELLPSDVQLDLVPHVFYGDGRCR